MRQPPNRYQIMFSRSQPFFKENFDCSLSGLLKCNQMFSFIISGSKISIFSSRPITLPKYVGLKFGIKYCKSICQHINWQIYNILACFLCVKFYLWVQCEISALNCFDFKSKRQELIQIAVR